MREEALTSYGFIFWDLKMICIVSYESFGIERFVLSHTKWHRTGTSPKLYVSCNLLNTTITTLSPNYGSVKINNNFILNPWFLITQIVFNSSLFK